MDENTTELLFQMLTDEQLMELREKGAMDGPSMFALKTEMYKRCLIEMPELLDADEYNRQWKAANEPKEETYVVTYLYAPLEKAAFGKVSCSWGLGSAKLKAKSSADAFEHFPDAIDTPLRLTDEDGNVTWDGPMQISLLAITCIGDAAIVNGADTTMSGKKEEPDE